MKSQIVVQNCGSLARIINALTYYQSLKQNIDDESTRYMVLGIYFDEEYVHNQFLNDYNHIISTHSTHLEDINAQINQCTSLECKIKRHNLKTSDTASNVANFKSLFLMELLDTIHHWLYHQFDVGMRVRRDVLNNLDANRQEDI